MAYNADTAKVGDRVRDKTTGKEWVLRPGGQWEEILVTGGDAASIGFIDKAARNVLNTPAALEGGIDAASRGLAMAGDTAVRSAGNLMQGRPASVGHEWGDARGRYANATEQTIPRFGDQVDAGSIYRSAVDWATSGRSWDEARQREELRRSQAAELFPRLHGAGEFGADFGALATMRRPVAKARGDIAATERKQMEQFIAESRVTRSSLDPAIQKKLDDVATKAYKDLAKASRTVGGAALKIGEAGLEGAYLAALNNDDPVVSAATQAGVQAAGSLGLWLSSDIRGRLVPFALHAFAAHELWKVFAPGPTNFFESEDFAFQLAAAGLTLGALGGLAGSGRMGASAIAHPQLADALTSLPRAAIENRWREFRQAENDGDPLPMMIMERIGRDPSYFNENQMRSLERAFNREREGAFSAEINRLMRDSEDFRGRVATMLKQRRVPEGAEPVRSGNPARDLQLFTPTNPIMRNR
jgi:hypothetical protein